MLNEEIEGVILTSLKEFKDYRGSVLHMLRADSLDFIQFGECYFSEVFPGAIKAWKKHTKQTQNIAVPVGRIKLVIYDNRHNSPTKNNLLILELGRPDAYFRVRIPPEVWYGFSCISSSAALLVNCADIPHSLVESEIVNYLDPLIPFNWEEAKASKLK